METTPTYTYDENGNVILESYDYDGDGITDYYITYTYNDPDGDGIPNSGYAYDSNGRLTYQLVDEDNDNIPEYSATYSYDTQGRLIEEVYRTSRATYTYNYVYDANGNLISSSSSSEGDHYNPYSNITYTYDSNNILISSVKDERTLGFWGVTSTTYDVRGNTLSETIYEYSYGDEGITLNFLSGYTYTYI